MGMNDVPPGACGAQEQVVCNSEVTLSAGSYTDGPVTATRAIVSVPQSGTAANGIVITLGGTTPASGTGIFVKPGESFTITSPADIAAAKLIKNSANVTVTVHYFR